MGRRHAGVGSHPGACLALLAVILLSASTAEAGRCVGIFFRGFNAPVGTSGMDNLEAHLQAALGGNPDRPFSTGVFDWTEQSQAFAFVEGFSDVECLVVAGHSFGANSAIELTNDALGPAGLVVDLLIQFDSVGANDGVLPGNVETGFNYHQVSTGLFEPQGESTVVGSTNVYVEADYGVSDSDITHTEIDCPLFERSPSAYSALFGSQPDLYARVEAEAAPLFDVTPVPSMGLPGLALLLTASLLAAGRSASGLRVSSREAARASADQPGRCRAQSLLPSGSRR